MRHWVWDLRTLAQFQGSEMSSGLCQDYGWVYKSLRLSSLAVEYSLVVMTADSQSIKIIKIANFRFPFYEICVQN